MSSFIEEFTDLEITSKPKNCCCKSKRRILQPSFNKTKICSTCKVEKDETDFQIDLKGNCKQICRQCTPKSVLNLVVIK
jgi:hypothetical protein